MSAQTIFLSKRDCQESDLKAGFGELFDTPWGTKCTFDPAQKYFRFVAMTSQIGDKTSLPETVVLG